MPSKHKERRGSQVFAEVLIAQLPSIYPLPDEASPWSRPPESRQLHLGEPPKDERRPWISAHNPHLHPSQAHYSCWVFHSTSESICRPNYWPVGLSPFTDIRVRKFRTLKYRHKISLGATKKMPTSHIIFYVVAQKLIKRMADVTLKYRQLRPLFPHK